MQPLELQGTRTAESEEEETEGLIRSDASSFPNRPRQSGVTRFRPWVFCAGLLALAVVVVVIGVALGSTKASRPSNARDSEDDPVVSPEAKRRLLEQQLQNYKEGKGIILNVHITHHAGTTFCRQVGNALNANGSAPPFACMRYRLANGQIAPDGFPEDDPWPHEDTSKNIVNIRQAGLHMVSWEYGYTKMPNPPLSDTDWEDPRLLSVIVMRNPMDRLLAGDGYVSKHYPGLLQGNTTIEQWWKYARTETQTNNYGLRVLAGNGCCSGASTPVAHLETAKALVRRFSVVLDMDCLDEGLQEFARLTNLTLQDGKKLHKFHSSARERIGHDDVYEYLLERNKMEIELFRWSKDISLVNCSALPST